MGKETQDISFFKKNQTGEESGQQKDGRRIKGVIKSFTRPMRDE